MLKFLMVALVGAQAVGGSVVKFTLVERGSYSHVNSAGVEAIRDQKALDAFAKSRRDPANGKNPLAVDFAKEQLVVIYGGQRSSGGFHVDVLKVVKAGSGATVQATVVAPPKGAMVTMALTTPYAVIRMPRFTGVVTVQFK